MAGETVRKREDVPAVPMAGDDVVDVTKRVLVGRDEGWDGHVMRLFEIGARRPHAAPHATTGRTSTWSWPGAASCTSTASTTRSSTAAPASCPPARRTSSATPATRPLQLVCIVPEAGEY